MQQTRALSALIDFAVRDLIDFMLIGDINLQRQKVSLENIQDQADARRLEESDMEHWVYALQCKRESEAGCLGGDHYDDSEWVEMAMAEFPKPRNWTAAVRGMVLLAAGRTSLQVIGN